MFYCYAICISYKPDVRIIILLFLEDCTNYSFLPALHYLLSSSVAYPNKCLKGQLIFEARMQF